MLDSVEVLLEIARLPARIETPHIGLLILGGRLHRPCQEPAAKRTVGDKTDTQFAFVWQHRHPFPALRSRGRSGTKRLEAPAAFLTPVPARTDPLAALSHDRG